jgi:hypothetical protein
MDKDSLNIVLQYCKPHPCSSQINNLDRSHIVCLKRKLKEGMQHNYLSIYNDKKRIHLRLVDRCSYSTGKYFLYEVTITTSSHYFGPGYNKVKID